MEIHPPEGLERARRIVDIASDKLATDIALLDSRGVCSFADFFVMVTGESVRQLKAIAEEVVHRLKQEGVYPLHREGTADSGWILLDYGDIIVHIFSENERQTYGLDEMWGQAPPVLRVS